MVATSRRAAPARLCSRASSPKAVNTASSPWSPARVSPKASYGASSSPTAARSRPTPSCSHAVRGWGSCFRTSLVIGSALPARRSSFSARPRATCGSPSRRCPCGRITGEVSYTGFPATSGAGIPYMKPLPVWADHGRGFIYGIPGNEWSGFKVADDTRWPPFDPTTGERVPTPEALKAAREYLAFRFPGLKGAPLVEARVCQYENSPDEHFIIDRHPAATNVWLVGGGSGHGFKHGPAVGELVAKLVLGGEVAPPEFRLSRFAPGARPGG